MYYIIIYTHKNIIIGKTITESYTLTQTKSTLRVPNANGWMTEVFVSIRLLQTDSENDTKTILLINMVNISLSSKINVLCLNKCPSSPSEDLSLYVGPTLSF